MTENGQTDEHMMFYPNSTLNVTLSVSMRFLSQEVSFTCVYERCGPLSDSVT